MPLKRAQFITFEGPEGSGKSTQIKLLAARLEARGLTVLLTREPGGTATGELIRDILQHGRSGETICHEAEVLLFSASRAQLVDRVIRPALARGEWVLCDRFLDSTTAYQSFGRGLDLDAIDAIHRFTVAGTRPDRTLLLDLDVAEALARMRRRNAGQSTPPDRFEREDESFHEKIQAGYRELARRDSHRIRIIDAALPAPVVADAIWEELADVRP